MEVHNLLTRQYHHDSDPNTFHSQTSRYRSSRASGNSQGHGTPSVAIKSEISNYDTRERIQGMSSSCSSSLSAIMPAKQITFELLLPELPQQRARLPMRVNIFPHDTTDSIIATVKNFYGLYEGKGVCFEDRDGNTLIARYENFQHSMVVYVRIIYESANTRRASQSPQVDARSPKKRRLDEPIQFAPPAVGFSSSRPASRSAFKRSTSPSPVQNRRSASTTATTNGKISSRTINKSRHSTSFESGIDYSRDPANCFSDSDGGSASVTSSRRERNDQLVSAEISTDNILEGGRRTQTKFDSSVSLPARLTIAHLIFLQELPLFVPPQIPITASTSSISPQRRIINNNNGASPFSLSNAHNMMYGPPLPSPQSYGGTEGSSLPASKTVGQFVMPSSHPPGPQLRARGATQYQPGRQATNGLILPTPDPTVGSVISDEDVALQLMRLGEASNFSTHGRTSTSTVDDTLSGKAELASSIEGSDEETDLERKIKPPHIISRSRSSVHGDARTNPTVSSGRRDELRYREINDEWDKNFKGNSEEMLQNILDGPSSTRGRGMEQNFDNLGSSKKPQIPKRKNSAKSGKSRASTGKVQQKGVTTPQVPQSPNVSVHSRKPSISSMTAQSPMRPDEEDLSSKPRCQRCRKSKKGCDRQRPCQRCKDAGIGIDGCVSEDEGNGRKGRYGRHMGVPVKKSSTETLQSAQSPTTNVFAFYKTDTLSVASAEDKNKKRKK